MSNLVYDFETNYEFWRNKYEDENPSSNNVSCSRNIVLKWINWVSELPRFEEISLDEFTKNLTNSEIDEFTSTLHKLADPLHMMSLDFDVCISADLNEVVRYMEQPVEIAELNSIQPFFKRSNV